MSQNEKPIIQVVLGGSTPSWGEQEVMSLQHVRAYQNGRIGLELPFYVHKGETAGAGAVYLQMSPEDALELANRLVNTVRHEYDIVRRK